ncbi:MAG: hypothetical protein ACI4OS_02005 [Akkermansia sp.]
MKKTLISALFGLITVPAFATYYNGGIYWIDGVEASNDANEVVDGKYVITSEGHDSDGQFTVKKGGSVAAPTTISSLNIADGHTVTIDSFTSTTVVTVEKLMLGTGSNIASIGNYVYCSNIVLGEGSKITGEIKLVQSEVGQDNCLLHFTLANDAAVGAALAAGASEYTVAVSATGSTIWNAESLSKSNMSFTYGNWNDGGVVYQLDGKYYATGNVAWDDTAKVLYAKDCAEEISLETGTSYVVIDKTQLISLTVTAPEPATATLSLLALVCVVARRRRQA